MKLLHQLVSIPSFSGEEQDIQRFIRSYCKGSDLKVVEENTIIHIPGKNSQKAVVFDAHVDTVKPGNTSLWKHDPFEAWEVKNKLYGLGASDEKSGIAMCLLLINYYSKHQPECDLWFMFVNQEETTGIGSSVSMDWFVSNHLPKYKKAIGILPEPTGLKQVQIGHKGNAFIKLTVTGNGGHGSKPKEVKVNAVLLMAEIILSLSKLEKAWSIYKDPILGFPSIAAGTSIQGGSEDTPNKIADTCTATIDVRTTPKLHYCVHEKLKKFLKKYPVTAEYVYPPIPHGFTSPNSNVVKAFKKLNPSIRIATTSGSTDLCFFTKHNIPGVIYGPGEKECIHKPNEYCYPNKITKAVSSIKQLIPIWVKTQ